MNLLFQIISWWLTNVSNPNKSEYNHDNQDPKEWNYIGMNFFMKFQSNLIRDKDTFLDTCKIYIKKQYGECIYF